MHLRHLEMVESRFVVSEAVVDALLADVNRLSAQGHRLAVTRVVCADCGVVMLLRDSVEIGETGRHLHPHCFLFRSVPADVTS